MAGGLIRALTGKPQTRPTSPGSRTSRQPEPGGNPLTSARAAVQTNRATSMDSSVSPTFGEQEGSAYNGHFGCTCYHPLFVFNQFGDLERCTLRPGNVHSAEGWREVLAPVVARYRGKVKRLYFRADAAFAGPELYDFLADRGVKYAIRLPANPALQESIAFLLRRPWAARRTRCAAS